MLVSGGIAVAEKWPKVKESAEQLKQIFGELGSGNEMSTSATEFSDKGYDASAKTVERAESDIKEGPLLPVDTSSDEEEQKYRFVLSTGTVGVAIGAQFGIIWLTPVSLVLTGYLSARILRSALTVIFQEKRIGVDILDSVVITLCLILNKIGPAAFMIWVLDLADMLLERTSRKSEEYLSEIFGEQVRTAWLLVDGEEIEVGLDQLKKGDIIAVNTGEQVPVDGVVTEGEAMIDQQSLTGEATPVEKRANDEVFAMTVLVAGKIQLKVSKTGQDTLASKIIQVINDASEHKVEMQSVGEKIADKMVLPTLGLGAMGYAMAGSGAMLAIINADFGTGIRVAAPVALIASLGIAAKNGVLIKDSRSLELLRDIDVVIFDKTGTLTYDIPVVAKIVSADDTWTEEKILLYTAAAEQKFSHPVARAILQKAEEQKLILPPHDDSKYYVGFGIEVTVHGDMVQVGSARYMENEQIIIPEN
ncbi:MAG: HAD family hydrolase, partial [Candidatus Electrothrix sp. MAN1_4]|nr:HAD family hydrolase [Candidatus Electrothrix sp. MAN1_4]